MTAKAAVKDVVHKAGAEVTGFARFQLGEGIDRGPQGDFAAEVAAVVWGLRRLVRPGALPLDPAGAVGPRPHFICSELTSAVGRIFYPPPSNSAHAPRNKRNCGLRPRRLQGQSPGLTLPDAARPQY